MADQREGLRKSIVIDDEGSRIGSVGRIYLDDATGEELGKLDKVLHYPAHKVYQVRGGVHEYLIPAVPGVFIASADPDAGIIRVHMMKGLATDEN